MNILLAMNGENCTIPPIGYGGTQRKLYWHAKELHRLGHNVWVMADPKSSIFKEIPAIKKIDYPIDEQSIDEFIPKEVDIIHYFKPPKKLPQKPYIFTEGCNGLSGQVFCPNTVFVSKSHAENHGAKEYVYGGLSTDEYEYSEEKEKRILYLALLNWLVKNARTAINLSIDLKIPLDLTGGEIEKSYKAWTSLMLSQRITYKKYIHHHGMVDGYKKRQLLKNAGILFYMINWHEPCANTTHEAFASGTPIIATPYGFLGEYIIHGENGYLVNSYSEALDCLRGHFSQPEGKRKEMSKQAFNSLKTISAMTSTYLKKYELIIRNKYLYPPENAKKFRFNPPQINLIGKSKEDNLLHTISKMKSLIS